MPWVAAPPHNFVVSAAPRWAWIDLFLVAALDSALGACWPASGRPSWAFSSVSGLRVSSSPCLFAILHCTALSLHGPWQNPAAQSPCGPVAQDAPVLAGSRGEPSRPPSCPSLQGVGSSSLPSGRLPGPFRAPLVRAHLLSFILLSRFFPLCWVSLRHTILTSSQKKRRKEEDAGGGRTMAAKEEE